MFLFVIFYVFNSSKIFKNYPWAKRFKNTIDAIKKIKFNNKKIVQSLLLHWETQSQRPWIKPKSSQIGNYFIMHTIWVSGDVLVWWIGVKIVFSVELTNFFIILIWKNVYVFNILIIFSVIVSRDKIIVWISKCRVIGLIFWILIMISWLLFCLNMVRRSCGVKFKKTQRKVRVLALLASIWCSSNHLICIFLFYITLNKYYSKRVYFVLW